MKNLVETKFAVAAVTAVVEVAMISVAVDSTAVAAGNTVAAVTAVVEVAMISVAVDSTAVAAGNTVAAVGAGNSAAADIHIVAIVAAVVLDSATVPNILHFRNLSS